MSPADRKPPDEAEHRNEPSSDDEVVPTSALYEANPARVLSGAYDYDESVPLRCGKCGWEGPASRGSVEYHRELFDVSCPKCDKMLLVVPYPTAAETEKAAAGGDKRALEDLPGVERRESRWERAQETLLGPDSELPELAGDHLEFVWDIDNPDQHERPDDEVWTVIRRGSTVVWREYAFWEGFERFDEVRDLLAARFGSRFAGLTPTPDSEMYLYGDNLGEKLRRA